MAYKILSVSISEDKIDILRLELGVTSTYVAKRPPETDVDQKTWEKAAQWADQILINADFPSAEYQWSVFAKVNNRILKQLVTRHGMQALESREGARVGFKDQGPVTVDGLVKRKVSYLAVNEEDVGNWEEQVFAKYRKKIRRITSLPVALSASVVQSEKPQQDFMVAWVGEMSTIFAISSPHGDIKVARNIPVGLDRGDLAEDEDAVLESFAREFDRDIMTTLLLYNDTFEEPACQNFYLLGNEKLAAIMERFPLGSTGEHNLYSLDHLPVRGLHGNDLRAYHLLGNLFNTQQYNLVSPSIIWGQRFDKGYTYATALLAAGIFAVGAWMVLTTPAERGKYPQTYSAKQAELKEINNRLYRLQAQEIELNRFSGWKDFYKNTYTNQPAWSHLFSSLAAAIPEEFVINSFEITPGKKTGLHGWTCLLEGHIQATHWNDGLALLREFGARIHQSPYYEILDVQYTPLDDDKNAGNQETAFDFVIRMKLTPQENKSNAS